MSQREKRNGDLRGSMNPCNPDPGRMFNDALRRRPQSICVPLGCPPAQKGVFHIAHAGFKKNIFRMESFSSLSKRRPSGQFSALGTSQMSSVDTGQMAAVMTRWMSITDTELPCAVQARHMWKLQTLILPRNHQKRSRTNAKS